MGLKEAGFVKVNRERLNYSQDSIANSKNGISKSKYSEFENGKKELSNKELQVAFSVIDYDYNEVKENRLFDDEYQEIICKLSMNHVDEAFELYNKAVDNGVFSSLSTIDFVFLDYCISTERQTIDDNLKCLVKKISKLFSDEQNSRIYYYRGLSKLRCGLFDEAVELLTQTLSTSNDLGLTSCAFFRLADADLRSGYFAKALNNISIAQQGFTELNFFELILESNILKAKILSLTSSYYLAIDLIKYASVGAEKLNNNELYLSCIEEKAAISYIKNDYDEMYENVKKLKPNSVRACIYQLLIHVKLNQYEQAVYKVSEAMLKYNDSIFQKKLFKILLKIASKQLVSTKELLELFNCFDYEFTKEVKSIFNKYMIDNSTAYFTSECELAEYKILLKNAT